MFVAFLPFFIVALIAVVWGDALERRNNRARDAVENAKLRKGIEEYERLKATRGPLAK